MKLYLIFAGCAMDDLLIASKPTLDAAREYCALCVNDRETLEAAIDKANAVYNRDASIFINVYILEHTLDGDSVFLDSYSLEEADEPDTIKLPTN